MIPCVYASLIDGYRLSAQTEATEHRPGSLASMYPQPWYCDYMRVGIRELKAHISGYIDRVKDGEIVDVTDRGTVVARLIPARASEPELPAELTALMAGGKVSWWPAGRSFPACR